MANETGDLRARDILNVTATGEFAVRVHNAVNALFRKAKAKDEFEYACALLRIRGLEDAGWDPLGETQALVADMFGLIGAPLRQDTRIRLALLTYCHLVEADAIYKILENMLRVIEGERCSTDPFCHLYRSKRKKDSGGFRRESLPPSAKTVVSSLVKHARSINEDELAAILEEMFDDQIRNAFFHSDYMLHENEFRSKEAKFQTGNIISSSVELPVVMNQMNRGLAFYLVFMQCYTEHIRSYTGPKKVTGRLLRDQSKRVQITLIADRSRGLYGFQSSSGGPVEER